MPRRRIRMKYLNPYSYKLLMGIVDYIDNKEFVLLEELYVAMLKYGWNRGLPVATRNQLLSILLKNLRNVVDTKRYKIVPRLGRVKARYENYRPCTLYSLKDNWVKELFCYFQSLKEKGERAGYYEVKG